MKQFSLVTVIMVMVMRGGVSALYTRTSTILPATATTITDTSSATPTQAMSDIDMLKAEIASLKKELTAVKKDVAALKFVVSAMDQVVTLLKKNFENHTHRLNGYTAEGMSTVKGGNANLIYLHVGSKLSQEKKDKLKQTSTPILE